MRGLSLFLLICAIATLAIFPMAVSAASNMPDSFVVGSTSNFTVSQGESLDIHIGVQCAIDYCTPPKSVAVWIFGRNYFHHEMITITDWYTNYVLPPEVTSNMEMGQYFVLIQHPSNNGNYDVELTDNYPSPGQTTIKTRFNYEYAVVEGPGKTDPALAAQRLIDMLNNPACDDTYMKLTFLIVSPPSERESGITLTSPGDTFLGEPLIVWGTTKEPAGSTVTIDLRSLSFQPGHTETVHEVRSAPVLAGEPSNLWYAAFDTGDYLPDEYLISVEGAQKDAFTTQYFNVLHGTTPPTFTLTLNRTEVDPGEVIEVTLTASTIPQTQWRVLDSSLAPEGFGVEILSLAAYDTQNDAWTITGRSLTYLITAPTRQNTYLLIPRVAYQQQSHPWEPLDEDAFVEAAIEAVTVGRVASSPGLLSPGITYLLEPVLPTAACPFCSVAAGLGIALLGAGLGTGTGTSSVGLFGWLARKMEKILEFLKRFLGFRTIGILGAKESKMRDIQPTERTPLFLGISAREWAVISASVAIFGVAFLIAGRLHIDPLSIMSFLLVGACAVIAHELATQWMAKRYGGGSEFQFWGLGTLILLFNSSLFGVTLGKPSRTVTARLESLTSRQIATLMLSGPVVNIIFALGSLMLIPLGGFFTLAGSIGFPLNITLAMYALLPVTPMKGKIVYDLNKGMWALAFLPALILFLAGYLIP
jgi:hypothetical protein